MRLFQALLLMVVLACSSACGGCKGPDDGGLCEDVDCEFGVCDPDSGECTNPATCAQDAPCLDGYDCVEGQCIAKFACEDDGSCERGVCADGACVNRDRCDADTDCVPGYACDGDQCVVDACDLVTCARGVCEQATGECVNAAVCTAQTQDEDCIEGYVCYDQTCTAEETVCAEIDCQRGVCSTELLDCINADDCGGDDRNCLDGYFCDDAGTCAQNVCDANMVTCQRGVCDEATGSCVNADTCSALTDCRDGYYCIGSDCMEIDAACGECPGNQICEYDEANLAVACAENPEGCSNALGCIGDRICEARQCVPAGQCEADSLEPNDSTGAALDWFTTAADGGISAGLCSGDEDWYSYDLAQDPQFTGTLVAQVVIPAVQVGIGTVQVELFDRNGASVATATSLAADATVRLEYGIGNINQGTYTLVVRDGGDIGPNGLDYTLYMDLVDETAATMCASAQPLAGTVMGDTSASSSNTLGSSCVLEPVGTEEVWYLDVPEPSFVSIDATNVQFDAALSLRRQCEVDATEISCSNVGGPRVNESLGLLLDAGRYVVVVEGAGGAQSGTYQLDVTMEPVVCTSADNSCPDANTAQTCNARGTGFDTQTCDNGCDPARGVCIRELADVCTSAIDATAGFSGTVSLGLLTADYDPGTTCVTEGSFGYNVTEGPDAVFLVTLQPGEVMHATAESTSFDYIGLYLVDDCSDVAANCLVGVNESDFSGEETMTFENTSGVAGNYYFVVDSEAGSTGSVQVDIVTGARICMPGEKVCNGTFLDTCNIAGTGYTQRTCTVGCDPATLACIPPPNDVCSGAIDISAGGQFTGDIADYNDSYSDPRNCVGYRAEGPDATFVLNGTPGDIAIVSLTGTYDASLYTATDCGNIAFSCYEGSDSAGSGGTETIEFRIPPSGTTYVIADTYSSSATGTFTLDVAMMSPACTTYEEAVACKADGTTLSACDTLGQLEDFACETTCTGAACDQPSGDRCFDAIMLTDGSSFTARYDEFEADYDPGIGTCMLQSADRQIGPDAVFAIDLNAGDLLTATLTSSTFGAGMYVMTDCADARSSCVGAAPRADELVHFANVTGRYYLVVDSTSSFSTSEFTVDVDIQQGFVCQPGGASCDTASGDLTVCNDDGTSVSSIVSCPTGCRPSGHCSAPSAIPDTCADALVVNGPVVYLESYGRFTNVLDPGANAMNSCGVTDTDGPDAIYQVALAAGEVVDVTVDDLGGTGSPRVYVATDCNDVENTCTTSDESSSVVRTAHFAAGAETVYVVVDNNSPSAADPLSVDIDVRTAECTPGTVACTSSNTGEFCNPYGQLESFDCYFGCAAGKCNPPTNDTCASPVDATGGGSFTIPIEGYMGDYDPGLNGCTDWYADGPDGVFKVTLAANEVIDVSLDATWDASLYITTTCDDVTSCVAGTDGFGTENLRYRATTSGDYFIHVDTATTAATGPFTLDVSIPPSICTPGAMACDATGQNIQLCDAFGISQSTAACDATGCVPGQSMCSNLTGESCIHALDASAGGMFTGNFTNFSDDHDQPTSDCTGWDSPGPDAVYFVDLLMGQTLTVTLDATSDTSLYLTSSCSDIAEFCLAGEDDIGSGEVVTYTATADERVFIFADNYDFFAGVPFTLDVVIN